ncbi:hypothetical protein K3495_g9373 [Podosphaera aphanis]|nr:hypothetical protein K3495_g9373 [Podosphaera aphanis]
MLSNSLNSSRGAQSSISSRLGTTQGGIRKRKSGPARLDKDGDMLMDAISASSRGNSKAYSKKRRSGRSRTESHTSTKSAGSAPPRGSSVRRSKSSIRRARQAILRGINSQQVNLLETVEVYGPNLSRAFANADSGMESLLSFLERKASGLDSKSNRPVKIKKSTSNGDSVLITASQEDIAQIIKLNNYQFAGVLLTIKPCNQSITGDNGDRISLEARNLKEEIQQFLATRYNVEHKLLDLSRLGNEPRLQTMGLVKPGAQIGGKLFPAIMAICDGLFKTRKDKQDAIQSISLSENSLSNINQISSLSQTFPDIKNLDLSGNKICDFKALDAWRWKFRSLEMLVLKDNPIEHQVPGLKDELMKRYPRLHTIDNVRVRTPEEINSIISAAEQAKTPIPIAGPLFHDVDQVGETFIRNFLPLYDSDRAALAVGAYDAESTFSVSINMTSPQSPEVTIPSYGWSDYVKHSRNLGKITHLPTRMHRQFIGTNNIKEIWSSLPATKHPDIDLENDKYLFEGHELPCVPDPTGQSPTGVTGMIITMHGEFREPGNSCPGGIPIRSFSRNFILGPGSPGGPAIRVISDMLVIRPWAPLAQPTTTFIAQGQAREQLSQEQLQQNGASNVEQQKEIMTRQFMEHTGMTMQYSILCLQQAEWNMKAADEMFNQTKAKLPAEAFVTSTR